MSDLREGFFQECDELLESLADGLAAIEAGTAGGDTVNAIFRAVHSIKGGAAAFGLTDLVAFAHSFENALDAARAGRLQLDRAALALCLRAGDRLADLVAAARDGSTSDPSESADLTRELDALLGPAAAPAAEAAPAFTPIVMSLDLPVLPGAAAEGLRHWRIRFAPDRSLYATGNDPAMLLRALEGLGEVEVAMDAARLPPLAELDWEESYLAWDVTLRTEATEARLREIFGFVEGSCRLEVVPAEDPDGADLARVVAFASRRDTPVVDAVAPAAAPVSDAPPTHAAAPPKPAAEADAAAGNPRATIRVDLDRVDRLINLVGELVINQAMLTQSIEEVKLPAGSGVEAAMGQLRQLSSELQERVMAIRAQPVKPLFQRMGRIVREAAAVSGKIARLVTRGEATEVDKTVIERLADPLTHMIRNAVDHGIETPETRLAAGKPAEGNLRLAAAHRSGRVIIELSDDGGGIDRARVHQTAVRRGLIAPDKELSDEDIDNLLFMPGFSTSNKVSSLSGRGVGMDVVQSEIQKLGGRVALTSRPGAGTTVSISLPLTLAVVEGMVVEAAGETLVVPTTALQETLKASGADIQRIGARGWFLSIRGGFVPIIDLGARLGFYRGEVDLAAQVLLLVETGAGRRAALAVDRVLDQREVVIKGLENNYGHVPGIAAATILGNGRIALIIDTDEVTATPAPPLAEPAVAAAAGA